MLQLPKGYYAVQDDFENAPKDQFTFRGVTYAVTEGVNLFGSVVDANAAATEVPDTVLEGLPYDAFSAPVLLFSVGTHRIDKLRFEAPRILLGEKAGVSPNLEKGEGLEAPAMNPERVDDPAVESILYGGYWYGAMRIVGAAVPLLLLDGFVMKKSRFYDSRPTGECDTEIVLRNLYHTSPCLHTIYSFDGIRAESPMHRTVLLEHVRLQKDFDELGYGRLFMSFASNKVTFRDLCIDGTTQLFGFTTISRASGNCAGNSVLSEAEFEDCYIRGLGGENGIAFSCPGVVERGFVMRANNSVFVDASRPNEAAFQVNLESDKCALSLTNCRVADTRGNTGAAVAIRGKFENVTLENCTVEGYNELCEKVTPPPTNAPDQVENRQRAWTTKTDDPHRVIGTAKADFAAMDAYYEGCNPYYGDQHVHSDCGGTSDGHYPLKDWTAKMDELGLDFAIVVDHRQMRGYFLPEWDETRFLYGTEPGTGFSDLEHLPNNSLHYNMIFPHKYGLAMVLANFPEFKFQGDELTGFFGYPRFTTERFKELNAYIRSIGGMLVHAHPKLLLASNDPLDYYAGEHSYLETIVNGYGAHGAFRACDLWEKILNLGKHMYASGGSDTHGNVSVGCPSTFYATERHHSKFVERMYVGDYAVGGVGVKMMIDGNPMGSELAYKPGMKLTLRVGDFFRHTWKENTAYELQILTDKGVAYSSLFNGKEMQEVSLEVQERLYYRVVVWDRTRGYRVCVSNPIWLDKKEDAEAATEA